MANMNQNGGGIGTMMQPKKKSYKDQSLTKAQQKKTKPANQGGGPNYLGKQEEVTTPKRWLSSPDHVVAELAYITPREQKILLDANIYGSLKGKPNKGPNGIMSLQGDLGGFSSGGGSGGSGGSSGGGGNDYKARDYYNMMTGTGTTAKSATGDTYRSNKIAKGAVPEFVNTPSGTKYVGSKFKSYGQPTFFGDLFSGGASGYRGTKGTGTGPFGTSLFAGSPIGLRGTRLKNGQILGGEYFSEDEDVGDLKQSIGERISNFGITGIVKNLFKKEPKDMTEFNNLTLDGIKPSTLDFDPNAKINNINTTVPDNSLALESFYNNQKPPANVIMPGGPQYNLGNFGTGITPSGPGYELSGFQQPSTIKGGMAPNDYDIGRTNLNDFSGVQNVDRSLTSNQIDETLDNRDLVSEFTPDGLDRSNLYEDFIDNRDLVSEFGDNRNINMDEFAPQEAIDNRLMQEYLTNQAGFQQPVSPYETFEDNRNIDMNEFAGNDMQMQNYLNDQANYNADPLGNPNRDPRIVSEEYGLVGNQTLPGNDTFAFAPGSIKDNQIKQAYDIYNETGFGKSNLEKLMQEDVESGGQLSLPQNAYSMIG